MIYADFGDLQKRTGKDLSEKKEICEALLSDAAVIIDTYGLYASPEAKEIVSCNMVLRAISAGDDTMTPLGATQGTVSALGYSQTWTVSGGGSVGELYLTKVEKRMLGCNSKIGASNPYD